MYTVECSNGDKHYVYFDEDTHENRNDAIRVSLSSYFGKNISVTLVGTTFEKQD